MALCFCFRWKRERALIVGRPRKVCVCLHAWVCVCDCWCSLTSCLFDQSYLNIGGIHVVPLMRNVTYRYLMIICSCYCLSQQCFQEKVNSVTGKRRSRSENNLHRPKKNFSESSKFACLKKFVSTNALWFHVYCQFYLIL